ncbi:MAG: response regulator [Nitrospirota bacterium]
MSVITVFSGNYCNAEPAIKEILGKTNYNHVKDSDIVSKASALSHISEDRISKAFSAKISVFNQFTREREKSIAYLRLAAAEMLVDDNMLVDGFTALLVPREISHVLRICIIADMKYRISVAASSGISESDALKVVHKSDEDRMAWTTTVLDTRDPWDSSMHDMVLPADKMSSEEMAALVGQMLEKDVLKAGPESKKAAEDFRLASRVEVALVEKGHFAPVKAAAGVITITVDKPVLMLKRLEEELKSVAGKIQGVKSVETKVGKRFYQSDIVRKFDVEMPSKLLLVDDERQFVQRLSERLLMREIGSAIAYDGESALKIVKEEEPDVMILDLKMPGIDGIEVLKRVKQTNPDMEVIILTGQGTEADRKLCMELGAFAYLEKPVDVEVLSETIKKANEKIKKKKT